MDEKLVHTWVVFDKWGKALQATLKVGSTQELISAQTQCYAQSSVDHGLGRSCQNVCTCRIRTDTHACTPLHAAAANPCTVRLPIHACCFPSGIRSIEAARSRSHVKCAKGTITSNSFQRSAPDLGWLCSKLRSSFWHTQFAM